MSDEWQRVCVLCAARGKTRRLESGHCCVECASWLAQNVADIARFAADAAAWVAPGSSTGGGSRPVPGSRPPLNVSAVDVELALIGPPPSPTVLDVLESWTRMVRESRELSQFGPWTALEASRAPVGSTGTSATLVACVSFLGRSVAWMIDAEDFPLEDFADEIRSCVRVLRRWDHAAEDMGTMVRCPTLHEDEGECGYRLHYRDFDEHVTCPRCRVSRDASTLVVVAMSDGRPVWLDPEAAASWLGVSEGTLRQWARKGRIERDHGRYLIRHAG